MLDILKKKPAPAPNAAPNNAPVNGDIIDSSEQRFALDVMEESMKRPVIVDFWAPWCGPCKQLGPIIEAQVKAQHGKVRLVKINVDENQNLSAQLRIQSIPMVYAFIAGRPVDGFAGAQGEAQIKAFIEKLLKAATQMGLVGNEGDEIAQMLETGRELLKNGDIDTALEIASELHENLPDDEQVSKFFIAALNAAQQFTQAEELIKTLPKSAQEWQEVKALRAASALAQKVQNLGDYDLSAWSTHKNVEAGVNAAVAMFGAGQAEQAIDLLCEIFAFERKTHKESGASGDLDSLAKKNMLLLFETLGFSDPLAVQGRRKLSAVMFS